MACCAGIPLIGWTLKAAKNSKLVNHIIVSTNDEAVMQYAWGDWEVRVFWRPDELATATSPTEDAIAHVLERWEESHPDMMPDVIMLLQPTSPARTWEQIDAAITHLADWECDSLVSVVPSHVFLWGNDAQPVNYDYRDRPMRQDVKRWEENGSIYAFTLDHWRKRRNRLGGKIAVFEMPEESRIQVDTPLDLLLVEKILERQYVGVAG